ncbi:uncharacterized protein JCM10292_004032 [Rhodotorula paludigena]|uniref:uncharacterized protein n=1 Tax=Rhodotorula paludigena TaxID=86838 RepID=UPI0031710A7A
MSTEDGAGGDEVSDPPTELQDPHLTAASDSSALQPDPEGDSFVALAALHDPSLFSNPVEESAHDASAPVSPTALEMNMSHRGRGRALRWSDEHGRVPARATSREPSLARSLCSASWSRRAGGAKGEASVSVQPESVSSLPIAPAILTNNASPQPAHHSRRRSFTVAAPPTQHTFSAAVTELTRLASVSPPTSRGVPLAPSLSPPSSPRRRVPFERRYSNLAFSTDAASLSGGKTDKFGLHRSPSSPSSLGSKRTHYGSLASLSRYLDTGRRLSAPSLLEDEDTSRATTPTIPSPSSAAPAQRSSTHLDLRNFAAGSYHAFVSSFSHLPQLYHHDRKAPSPISPTSPSAPLSPVEPKPRSWDNVKALNVRFRPSSHATSPVSPVSVPVDVDSRTSTTAGALNAWVLGLTDLSLGGSREWDPRSTSNDVDQPSSSARRRGRSNRRWPVVTTRMGSPPTVEVEFRDGGRWDFDPSGMEQEEIMRTVLAPSVQS